MVAANSLYGQGFWKFVLAVMISLVVVSQLPRPAKARPAFSAISVDARTGRILYAKNADARRYPASLTKMMTLYLLFEDLKAGRISLDTPLRISRYAASRPPSKIGFRPGATIRVRYAIMAMVTKSANDVATAVAENLSGSESRFAARMTRTARRIGMTRTTFRNASGLPDSRHVTTARDMATLGLRLQRDFPRYFRYFSIKRFAYKGRRYGNHNRLLGRIRGVNGIKTGYTRASGYNLTSSVQRGRKRIVAVVMGGRTGRARNAYMTRLINQSFARYRLSSANRIASTAGHPPGYRPVKTTRIASVKIKQPPLPRIKPQRMAAATPVIKKVAALKKPTVRKPAKMQDRIVARTVVPVNGKTFRTASMLNGANHGAIDASFSDDPESRKADMLAFASTGKPVIRPVSDRKTNTAKAQPDPHSGTWNIQIGAFPTRTGAQMRLQKAVKKAARNLRNKEPFTMEVKKGGALVYRARFSGFTRKTARRTCRALSRRGFGCFALAPRS